MKFFGLFWIFLLVLTVPVSATSEWASNDSLVVGLGDVGTISSPTIYTEGGTLKMISGEESGTFNGYDWDGSTWSSNATLVSGLVDAGIQSSPTVFYDGDSLKLITGDYTGIFVGYDWDGSTWSSNATLISGLVDVGWVSSPTVYSDGDVLKLITGNGTGFFTGYDWGGSTWSSNATIVSGLVDVGDMSSPDVFRMDNSLKLIAGNLGGVFVGYDFDGSTWSSNATLFSGLGDVGQYASSSFYSYAGRSNMMLGEGEGQFSGVQYNAIPTTPSSITDLGLNLLDHSPSISWTKGIDVDGDTVKTYVYVGTNTTPTTEEANTTLESFDLGTNVSLSDGGSYYYRLRSFDGLSWSDYTSADLFRMNSNPDVSSAIIYPTPADETVDLIALNGSVSDAESDTVSLYYRWYKDGVVQSPLNNLSTILADNTTIDESWVVGIIPNDGFENGTETSSSAVVITSSNIDNFTFSNLTYTTPIKTGRPSSIFVDISDSDGVISSAIIKIHGINYTMQYISGNQWRYIFTSDIITNHYITNIYATDNASGTNSTSFNSIYIKVESPSGGGGSANPQLPPAYDDDNDDGVLDNASDSFVGPSVGSQQQSGDPVASSGMSLSSILFVTVFIVGVYFIIEGRK